MIVFTSWFRTDFILHIFNTDFFHVLILVTLRSTAPFWRVLLLTQQVLHVVRCGHHLILVEVVRSVCRTLSRLLGGYDQFCGWQAVFFQELLFLFRCLFCSHEGVFVLPLVYRWM